MSLIPVRKTYEKVTASQKSLKSAMKTDEDEA